MEWFKRALGFVEMDYLATQQKLLHGNYYSPKEGTLAGWAIGDFYFKELNELREMGIASVGKINKIGKVNIEHITGESRALHSRSENEKAMFQVASQFNCLEFPSARYTPEDGVTSYVNDRTQGPACAVACGAAAVFRNYLVKNNGQIGQTKNNQLNAMDSVFNLIDNDNRKLLCMKNGYLDCSSSEALEELNSFCLSNPDKASQMTDVIKVGAHFNSQVTDVDKSKKLFVGQCYCAAPAISYSRCRSGIASWSRFSQIILNAQYEACLWYTILYHERCISEGTQREVPKLLLTKVGGGVFGNEHSWITSAMQRTIDIARKHNISIDIKIVHYKTIDEQYLCVK